MGQFVLTMKIVVIFVIAAALALSAMAITLFSNDGGRFPKPLKTLMAALLAVIDLTLLVVFYVAFFVK